MNNYCVYRHIRLDTNKVFYIGLGNNKRPYDKNRRSNFWKNIINKTDYVIEILAENLTKEDACELEIFLIELYGRKNNNTGILCNLTDGGEGSKNCIFSKESRDKISKANKNRIVPQYCLDNLSNLFSLPIINVVTKQIYKNSKEVAKIEKYSWATIRLKVLNKIPNNTPYLYLKDYNNLTKNEILKRTNQKIYTKNKKIIDTKTNIIYESICDCSNIYGISKSNLSRLLNNPSKNKTNLKFYNE